VDSLDGLQQAEAADRRAPLNPPCEAKNNTARPSEHRRGKNREHKTIHRKGYTHPFQAYPSFTAPFGSVAEADRCLRRAALIHWRTVVALGPSAAWCRVQGALQPAELTTRCWGMPPGHPAVRCRNRATVSQSRRRQADARSSAGPSWPRSLSAAALRRHLRANRRSPASLQLGRTANQDLACQVQAGRCSPGSESGSVRWRVGSRQQRGPPRPGCCGWPSANITAAETRPTIQPAQAHMHQTIGAGAAIARRFRGQLCRGQKASAWQIAAAGGYHQGSVRCDTTIVPTAPFHQAPGVVS